MDEFTYPVVKIEEVLLIIDIPKQQLCCLVNPTKQCKRCKRVLCLSCIKHILDLGSWVGRRVVQSYCSDEKHCEWYDVEDK